MRPQILISSFITLLFLGLNLKALELGEPIMGGNGCISLGKAILSEGGVLKVPLGLRLVKQKDTAFDRKTCNFRLPISLNANEKLQILDASQSVRILTKAGAQVKSTLNISLVGHSTKDLSISSGLPDKNTSAVEILKSEKGEILAETECGQSAMLAGNHNILATGAARSFTSTGSARITLKIVSCE